MRGGEEKHTLYSGGRSDGKRPLGRSRYRREDIIKIDH
jgi:hypothetical protein